MKHIIFSRIFIYMLLIATLGIMAACGKGNDEANGIVLPEVILLEEADVGDFETGESIEENTMQEESVVLEPEEEYEVLEDLYTEPILMNPDDTSIEVVWFSEGDNEYNGLALYENGPEYKATRIIDATSMKMSRLRGGRTESDFQDAKIKREIYRHSVLVSDLPVNDGEKDDAVSYRIVTENGRSRDYKLRAKAVPGTAQKILLTSDHQNKNMCAANIQKVYEAVGDVDAVFIDGDIVDITDSAYYWFDADNSFFKVMQGKANHKVGERVYTGAPILQNAPIYTALGNHDVMGVYSDTVNLADQFNYPRTREYALSMYSEDLGVSKEEFVRDNSFNTISYEEIFSLPKSKTGDERYYAVTIGDVRLIVLEVNRIWRLPNVGIVGKYSEIPGSDRSQYGFGQFIFEPIGRGSKQYEFLKEELESKEYKNAKYKMVMYHFDNHSLGGNCIPAYTDPVASTIKCPVTGYDLTVYDYPIGQDYIINDVEPLLESHGVNLLFTAHSHIWNRFKTGSGMNILQSSNVGNNYGAFTKEGSKVRSNAPTAFDESDMFYSIRDCWKRENYVLKGDVSGLEPIYPNRADLPNGLPYLASDTITEFSILDTERGVVDSYYFDTTKPDSEVILFDSFSILGDNTN